MNSFRTFENLRCSRQHLHVKGRSSLLYWLCTRFSCFVWLYLRYWRCWSWKIVLLLNQFVRLYFGLSFRRMNRFTNGLLGDWGWEFFRTWNTFAYHSWIVSCKWFPLLFVNVAATLNIAFTITQNEARSWGCFILLNSHAYSLFMIRWFISGWLWPLIHWHRLNIWWFGILSCVVFTWHKSHFYLCSCHLRLCCVRLWWQIWFHVWMHYWRFCRKLLLLLRGIEI